MINLKTNCKNCVHEKVCKNHGKAELFNERICDLTYGTGTNDVYDWKTMSDYYRVQIDISCMDFEKRVSNPRKAIFS